MRKDLITLHKAIMHDQVIMQKLRTASSIEEQLDIVRAVSSGMGIDLSDREIIPYLPPNPALELSDHELEAVTGGKQGQTSNPNERLYGTEGNDNIHGNDGDDTLYGYEGDDQLYGDTGNDTIHGGQGDDTLDGDFGMDTLYGGEGNDQLDGGMGNDRLWGGEGDDTISGGIGNDMLRGGEGNDFLSGGENDDDIEGGAGDDIIHGGSGQDTLTGGEGNDIFAFGRADGFDTIKDFNPDEDKLAFPEGTDMQDIGIKVENGSTIVVLDGTIIKLEGVEMTRDEVLDNVTFYS